MYRNWDKPKLYEPLNGLKRCSLYPEFGDTIHSTKISGPWLKSSWGQMDCDRPGRSCSIPLSKRVKRSFKMEDVE